MNVDRLLSPVSNWMVRRSVRRQRDADLWDASRWSVDIDDDGHLRIGGVDACQLLEQFGSPVQIVNLARLEQDVSTFIDAANAVFDKPLVAFSYKTNGVPALLRAVHDAGAGAEVISDFELWLAERLGLTGDRIVVNGVNKTQPYLERAARLSVGAINVDSLEEMDAVLDIAQRLGAPINVGLRLRLDPSTHFGLLPDSEAMQAAAMLREHAERLRFVGLQFHCLANNSDARRHIALMKAALKFAVRIKFELGLTTSQLDIGGGLAAPTVSVATRWQYARQRLFKIPPDPAPVASRRPVAGYLRDVADEFDVFCRSADLDPPRIVLEPGRVITSPSHIMLTTVHGLKQRDDGASYALTDAGRLLTSFPCDYEYHQIFVANRMQADPVKRYFLTGRLCTTADWLAYNRFLPKLSAGDALAIMDSGAYFTSHSPNFAFPRPPIVAVKDGNVTVMRTAETHEHIIGMDDGTVSRTP